MRGVHPLRPHVTHIQAFRCHPSSRPRSGKYNALDNSGRGCHIATKQSRHNHSPYSDPTVLIAPYESISTAPRPCSSGVTLDRGGLFVLPVSLHGQKSLAPCISSREPSPGSQASFPPSVTDSPNIRGHQQSITAPPSHASAGASASANTSASGAHLSSQMVPFINTTPGDTQDAKTVGVTRRRTPPPRKRKVSEVLVGSGSEDRACPPEPSENEAKKKYKKKMNVRHYRAQNKDAMTLLRDDLFR